MSPFSGTILGAAAVVVSPTLWASLVVGTMPVDVAMTRYLIAVFACWVAVSLVVDLAFPSARDLARADQERVSAHGGDAEATTVLPQASAPSGHAPGLAGALPADPLTDPTTGAVPNPVPAPVPTMPHETTK